MHPRTRTWAAFSAAAWAFLFAVPSFYWAAGGAFGVETQAPGIVELAEERDTWFVALLWGTGVLKLLGGIVALALVRAWGRRLLRTPLLVAAWAGGVVAALWGGLNLVVGAAVAVLQAVGAADAPDDPAAFWWHLLLWDPWWLLGGILFIVAARRFQVERQLLPRFAVPHDQSCDR